MWFAENVWYTAILIDSVLAECHRSRKAIAALSGGRSRRSRPATDYADALVSLSLAATGFAPDSHCCTKSVGKLASIYLSVLWVAHALLDSPYLDLLHSRPVLAQRSFVQAKSR